MIIVIYACVFLTPIPAIAVMQLHDKIYALTWTQPIEQIPIIREYVCNNSRLNTGIELMSKGVA